MIQCVHLLEIELWMLCILYLQRLILTACKDHLKVIFLTPSFCVVAKLNGPNTSALSAAVIMNVLILKELISCQPPSIKCWAPLILGILLMGPSRVSGRPCERINNGKLKNTSRIARNPFVLLKLFFSLAFS